MHNSPKGAVEPMLEKIKMLLNKISGRERREDNDSPDDRDAGTVAPVRRRPPNRGSAVAVAEPDDDE